jgi:L-threonylcarbamoyladenylate synthase
MIKPDIGRAVELLRASEIVAFPTETVYGLGADALRPEAVAKIFAAKGRPADHPLIVHLPADAQLENWARELPRAARILSEALWPGPLTLILKRNRRVPDAVTGGQDTVALRVPAHPVARELLARFAGGIAAPSANRFGRISPTTAAHVRAELGDTVPLVLDGGPCEIGIESTILDLTRGEPVILRPGAVTAAEIADLIEVRPREGSADDGDAPRVSGSLPAHYAPRTPLLLVPAAELAGQVRARLAQGLRLAVLAREAARIPEQRVFWERSLRDPAGYAHDLYAHLRALDAEQADLILVEAPPQSEPWRAVNDRLNRAATGAGSDEDT